MPIGWFMTRTQGYAYSLSRGLVASLAYFPDLDNQRAGILGPAM
jgi:hypothetical protein